MVSDNLLVPLLAVFAVTACADRRSSAEVARPGSFPGARWEVDAAPRGCSVTVVFGSFATGPDRRAILTVSELLSTDPAVDRITRSAYGREGEHSLCIRTLDQSAATRVFNRLKTALRGPAAAPVSALGPHGEAIVAPLAGDRAPR